MILKLKRHRVPNPEFAAFRFRFVFGEPPLTEFTESTDCPPKGDPELDVFDVVKRPVPVLWCGIGRGIEEEAEGGGRNNPCCVACGVNKWFASFP